ncbi:hypothetical protein GGS21DRAFT_489217 [Xylaria nigripes]|nr:hypothetical protein GGS21DRAFT_489217 [Xylaria nigripes]
MECGIEEKRRYIKSRITSVAIPVASQLGDSHQSSPEGQVAVVTGGARGIRPDFRVGLGTFPDTSESDFDATINVNSRSAYFGAQLAARAMISSGTKVGSIAFVSILVTIKASREPPATAYAVSKEAVN